MSLKLPSSSSLDSSNDDHAMLNADNFLRAKFRKETTAEAFWNAVKLICIALSLLLSTYALLKCGSLRSVTNNEHEDMDKVRAELLRDELREQDQFERISRLNSSLLDSLVQLRKDLRSPDVMFDCYRVNRLTRATVVTYDGCFVDTTDGAVNVDTGFFTVRSAGVYQLSFTAKYVSSSKGRFGAWSDIFVNETVIADSQREYNGNELSSSESSTHTIMVLYPLVVGDLVKVQFNKDGSSYIHSDNDHDVHFTGRRVSALPREKDMLRQQHQQGQQQQGQEEEGN